MSEQENKQEGGTSLTAVDGVSVSVPTTQLSHAVGLMMNANVYEALTRIEELLEAEDDLSDSTKRAIYRAVSLLYEGMSQLVKERSS